MSRFASCIVGGPKRQFLVRPVHRVAGLECNHLAPAELALKRSRVSAGRIAQSPEIVMTRRLDAAQLAAEINRVRRIRKVIYARVLLRLRCRKRGALRATCPVSSCRRLPSSRSGRPSGSRSAIVSPVETCSGKFGRDVERDRHRPEDAAGKSHVLDNAVVFGLGQKSLERRERAVKQQLDIANLPRGQVPGRVVQGFLLFFFRSGFARDTVLLILRRAAL